MRSKRLLSVIADIASGTGIFTRMLLENGNRVFGVEPNAEMRHAAEEFLRPYSHFTSVAGTAEATTLADHSVDLVTAAQAAHWFDREKARREFIRIGKPGAWTVLLWNERRTDSTPFLSAYEQLLVEYGTDYQDVRSERTTQQIETFFAPAEFRCEPSITSRTSTIRRSRDGCCLLPTLRKPAIHAMNRCSASYGECLMSIVSATGWRSNTIRGFTTDNWAEPCEQKIF